MSLLDELVAEAQVRVETRRKHMPQAQLVEQAVRCTRNVSLIQALQADPAPRFIAEIKRASPSAGVLNADLDAAAVAEAYCRADAAAVSVLTEPDHFRGSLEDLEAVSEAVEVPVLRKDFIVDPYQVWEARAAGADAVLLIVRTCSATLLVQLLAECREAGVEALVEVHDPDELAVALGCGARLVGLNARDLTTFEVDLSICEELAREVPPGICAVAESGVSSADDVKRLSARGLRAFLVGTHLVTQPDPEAALRELRGD